MSAYIRRVEELKYLGYTHHHQQVGVRNHAEEMHKKECDVECAYNYHYSQPYGGCKLRDYVAG